MTNIADYSAIQRRLVDVPSKYILLGNGFSIALKPDIFTYQSLFENADLAAHPHLAALFDRLGTADFELVIRDLITSARTIEAYEGAATELSVQLRSDADILKGILVQAIAGRHPDRPYDIEPDQYAACRRFLQPFGHIFTMNYDVVLYWTLMQDQVDDLDLRPDDGFRNPENEEPFVTWQEANRPTVHYLHGALHLFDDAFQIIKFTWSKTDVPIVEQIRQALANERYPIFVAEGSSHKKMERILHNAYLHKALRSLDGCCKTQNAAIIIFGHSLADNDAHILNVIARGKIRRLFVSIFGDPTSPENRLIIERASALSDRRSVRYPLAVEFFDANSAQVWG